MKTRQQTNEIIVFTNLSNYTKVQCLVTNEKTTQQMLYRLFKNPIKEEDPGYFFTFINLDITQGPKSYKNTEMFFSQVFH